ncbi:MAG: hypothetical protein LBK57_05445 [Clostridiales Family XIII bacterium]|jgi:hypothetical protein|nr:hypothetical protein [Clostridiales Family XIII bacterium]
MAARNRYGIYQYLLCVCTLPKDMRTAKIVADAMGVSQQTAYRWIGSLLDKGFLFKDGDAYAPSAEGQRIVRIDRDTLGNLMFWLCYDLRCTDDEARKLAMSFLFRLPIKQVRVLANLRASLAALALAGAPADGALAALPRGRHEAFVFVQPVGAENPGVGLRRPVACVSDGEGNCVLEPDAEHVRRIVLACGRYRGSGALLWFLAGGIWIPARKTAGRFHIGGDALTSDCELSENSEIIARVRVRAAIDARHTPAEAELVLRLTGKAKDASLSRKGDGVFLPDR